MRLPRRAKLVLFVTIASSVAATAALLDRFAVNGLGPTLEVGILTLFLLASWVWPIVMYHEASSQAHHLDEGFFVVLALVARPPGVLAAFFLATVVAQAVRRRPFIKSVFNVAQVLLAATAGLALVHALAPPTPHLTAAELGAGVLGAVAYFLINSAAIASVLAATGSERFARALVDGLQIRSLLLATSVALGLIAAMALSVYSYGAILVGLLFWMFRQTLAGHFRARHDRTRLLGLFHATLDVHRTMGENEVSSALEEAASHLLRSPDVSIDRIAPVDGRMSSCMAVEEEERWLVVGGRSRAEPFDSADRALLDALAAVGSGALENSALYEEGRQQQERLVAITSSLGEGVCALDASGHVTFLNPAAEELLHWSEAELSVAARSGEVDLDFLTAPALRSVQSGATLHSERATFVRRDGRQIPVEYTCSPIRSESGVRGAVVAFRDISERIAFEEQLAYHAFHDALTGLPIRRVFLDRLQHALNRSDRTGAIHAVLFADVDRFKVANDSLGHRSGDQLLMVIADRLREVARADDTPARFGGDEFTLLVEDIANADEARAAGAHVLESLQAPIMLDSGRTVVTSVSIGVALATAGCSADDVLHDADVAMYQAKRHGGNQCEMFDADAMSTRSAEWVDLELELREAIERDELIVLYQPLFSTDDLSIVGAEALVRWDHPTRGLLEPSQFISLAEETGLILPLGRFVLDEACRQAKKWSTIVGDPFSVSVNLSARQFQSSELAGEIREAVRSIGLDRVRLSLEITESLALQDIEQSIATLTELRALGVQVAVDDFGTGYSSLSYLKRLPLDVVKLDQSFVQDLDISPVDTAIVAAVVELARTVGMTAIAEGVETEQQLERLSDMGCPVVQGFLLSRPLTAEALTRLLRDNERVGGRRRVS